MGSSAQGASPVGHMEPWGESLESWGWMVAETTGEQAVSSAFLGPLPYGSEAGRGVVPYSLVGAPQFRPLTATPWYPQGAIATLGWVLEQMLWSPFLVRAGKLWGHLTLGKPMQPNQVRF